MIAFIGDVHRSFDDLESMVASYGPEVNAIIQVGDLGVWPTDGMPPGTHDLAPCRALHFIDGNWDYYPWLTGHRRPVEIMPHVIYVPRGQILEMDGRRVAFLGGAESATEYGRTKGINWWPDDERLQSKDLESFRGQQADILVCHVPPARVLRALWAHKAPPRFATANPTSLLDELVLLSDPNPPDPSASAEIVERAWKLLGRPTVVAGHVHRSWHSDDVHVLDEMEDILL